MDDTNPYASPSDYRSPKEAAEPTAIQRTRWRIIPSTLLVLLGGMLAVSGGGMLAVAAVEPWFGSPVPVEVILAGALDLLIGFVWVWSGLAIWRRMWWRGILAALAVYVLGALGAFFVS